MFSSSIIRLVFVLVVGTRIFAGCVGKAKYYSTLQEQASAKSELGIVEMDLGDARAEIDRKEALIAGLRTEIGRLDDSVTDLSTQSASAQVQIGASLNKTQNHLDETQAKLADAQRQLSALKSYHSKRGQRLAEVERRLSSVISGLPSNQVSTARQGDESITLLFAEGLFFVKKGSIVSDYGQALTQSLASSLIGQSDLLVDVVAYPSLSAGTIKSWESASERANTIAFAFVSEFGLSPKQVSATGLQGEIVIIDGAPAESKQRKTVELVIRLNPSFYPLPALER
ncbi:MAG: hypothetical protein AB8F78_08520 [Saprospiraceae bacterium]